MAVKEIDLGKVVGPTGPTGATGATGPRGPGTNPNLLDNWYFADPINQRGKTEYTSAGYTIDRWRNLRTCTMRLATQGLQIHPASSNLVYFNQPIENPSQYAGKQMTVSFFIQSDAGVSGEVWGGTGAYTFINRTVFSGGTNGVVSCTFTAGSNFDHVALAIHAGNTASAVLVKAAKLELGDSQSLAHQDDNGNWVLNDPPPNKALELAKCQRYYQRYDAENAICAIFRMSANRSSISYIYIPTPVAMRANPAVSISGEFDTHTSSGETAEMDITYSGSGKTSGNGVTVMSATASEQFDNVSMGFALPYQGGVIALSAEL